MATLIKSQRKEQQQNPKTVKDKSKQIWAPQEQKQQQHHHHYYYQPKHKHHKTNEVINEDVNNKNDDDEVFKDFYHIKQCYHPTTTETTTSTKTTSKIRTLNQRTNYSITTTTPLSSIATATSSSSLSYVLHSLSHNCRSLVIMLLMGYLLLVHYAMAAPQSCILCDKNDLLAKDPQNNFEEFLFEHQVTRQDAINALRQLNESFYEGTSTDSSCNGVRCTEKVMKYCLGPQFINDHCWCEVGHSTEGLPYVPHICYVGEKIYKTSVGSCFFYEEVKDCCCSSVLAKEWRHISAGSSLFRKTRFQNCHVLAVISLMYLLLIRRSYSYN